MSTRRSRGPWSSPAPGLSGPASTSGKFRGFPVSQHINSAFAVIVEDSGISVLSSDAPVNWISQQAGGAYVTPPVPASLGPRYRVVLTVHDGETTTVALQDLYPYAKGGPLLFTPLGQSSDGSPLLSGWYRSSERLFPALLSLGLPSSAPRVVRQVSGQPTRSTPGPTGVHPWIWILIVGGVLMAVGAGVTAGWRRRSPAAQPG